MTAALDRAPRFRRSAGFDARYELGRAREGRLRDRVRVPRQGHGEKLACKVLNKEHVRRRLGKEASREASIMRMLTSLH